MKKKLVGILTFLLIAFSAFMVTACGGEKAKYNVKFNFSDETKQFTYVSSISDWDSINHDSNGNYTAVAKEGRYPIIEIGFPRGYYFEQQDFDIVLNSGAPGRC
ncbi:MAG: hypothetical protein IJY70_02335, partial [Clostridia bacterium]|nr:hypothetical protein [Clostridia bacterium]